MCSPQPPASPDMAAAARAQGAANEETARLQARANNPNVITPFGTQEVSWGTGTLDDAGYKAAMDSFNQYGAWGEGNKTAKPTEADFMRYSDQPTITQTYAPEYQKLLENSRQLQEKMGLLGLGAADVAEGTLKQGVDFGSAPQVGDGASTRQKVYDAMMSRVNEDTSNTRDQTNSDLIAAGIRPGTKAYGDRMNMIDRGYNDARMQAELGAGSEASRAFGQDMDARRQAITEIMAKRQTPLQEINAFRSGGQITPLSFPGVSQTQFSPAPIYGAAQAQMGADQNMYNAKVGQSNAMTSGLFGLGSAGLGAYGALGAAGMAF